MRRLAVALVGAALVSPAAADAGRFAVGIAPGADAEALASALEARTGGSASVIGPFAVGLSASSVRGVAGLPGVAYVERLTGGRRLAFAPSDPYFFSRQWFVSAVRGFDAWPQRPTWLRGLRLAVIDSGIDGTHPEFQGRIAGSKSFVGGNALRDTRGHGTFVAGLMVARLDNAEGIAGIAFPAQLLVAKVVRSDGVVPLEAEARAIRWAVDSGARVINLSLGGIRDPLDPNHDSYSALEADAVAYAVRRGAVVVASVGNGDQAPEQPWRYASYPAALPHVLGVSAFSKDGNVPAFSNRDMLYNDIAAPGDELFSTLPRNLTALRTPCLAQGYSDCGPIEFRSPQGTSFAAAIVSASAALVWTEWPALRASQIVGLLERSAVDMTPANGCRRCLIARDSLTGWGRLDVTRAIQWPGLLPAIDRYETNDDAGARAWRLKQRKKLTASLDFWNDQSDVYAVRLRKGQRLRLRLTGLTKAGPDLNLAVWLPGTKRVDHHRSVHQLAGHRSGPSANERLAYRAPRAGLYYVQVKVSQPGAGSYQLRLLR
jgi:subtilisin family serine protease